MLCIRYDVSAIVYPKPAEAKVAVACYHGIQRTAQAMRNEPLVVSATQAACNLHAAADHQQQQEGIAPSSACHCCCMAPLTSAYGQQACRLQQQCNSSNARNAAAAPSQQSLWLSCCS